MTQVGVGRQEQCGLAGGPDIRCYAIVSCVSREEERYTPSSSIPYANGGVQSSGSDPHTIKSNAVYLVEMTFEDMDAFTRIHVPYLCTKQHHQHQLESRKHHLDSEKEEMRESTGEEHNPGSKESTGGKSTAVLEERNELKERHHVNPRKPHQLERSISCGMKEDAIWTRRKSFIRPQPTIWN